jgi:ankyrin repeat protein
MAKRQAALSSALILAAAVHLSVISLAAQSSNASLERAVERIERNDVNGLRRLLKEEPSLVRRTEAGVLPTWRWTLLHSATAAPASLELVAALIDAGAEINVKDNEGNTPLHFAVKRINREKFPTRDYEGIIRLLLEKKADVHIVNAGGATPLHTAAAFRADPSAVEMLIQAGADVNLKTFAAYDGWTPLHGAAARNSAGIVAVLLKHGADLTARDGKGLTALEVAERGGFADATRILRTSAAVAPPRVTASPPPVAALPPPVVPPAPPRSASTGGTVQGRVLWNGQPVAGATAFVADSPPGSLRYGTATTDDQGRFSISGVPEGPRVVFVQADPRVFGPSSATFTMTASPFTQDFHLCKIFQPVFPSNNESVAGRPVLRWDPYPDAVRYFAVVLSQNKSVFSRGGPQGDLAGTSVQVDVDLPPGAYQWRLFAYNSAGQMIGCASQLRVFTIRP